MLAKHSHTETKSTERQQRNPKLDTENITSNVISIIILSKTCRLIFAECFLLFFCFFFNILTVYKVMQRKQCRQAIPVDETQHSRSEPRRGRERKRKRKGGREKREGGQASALQHLPAQVQHEVGK